MKHTLTTFLVYVTYFLGAQAIADFEEFNLPQDTYNNGSDGSGGFISGNVLLPNDYSFDFNAWTGWALSTMRDTLSPGFLNQYSCITGSGAGQTETYAVAFALEPATIKLIDPANSVDGMFVCNATYPYWSMLEGDGFSKRFGGADGNDPDFFLMTIKKYRDGILSTDSVEFYLADFRPEDPGDDYIVDEWTYVDLSTLGAADSLHISLSSSDVGIFGMNTPAFFCVDKIVTSDEVTTAIDQLDSDRQMIIYPNPVIDYLTIENQSATDLDLKIYDLKGSLIVDLQSENRTTIDCRIFPPGVYYVQAFAKNTYFNRTFLKR